MLAALICCDATAEEQADGIGFVRQAQRCGFLWGWARGL